MSIKDDLQKAVRYGNAKIAAKGGAGTGATLRGVLDDIDTISSVEVEVGDLSVKFIHVDPATGNHTTTEKRCNAGGSVTPPSVGDIAAVKGVCPDLLFQQWNHYEASFSNIQHNMVVGAMYIPTDFWSHFLIRITKTTGADPADALNQVMYLNKLDNSPLTFQLLDTTGSLVYETTNSTTGKVELPFTVPAYGDYWVKTKITAGAGAYNIGNVGWGISVFGGNNAAKSSILHAAFLGQAIAKIDNNAFQNCTSLSRITISSAIVSFGSAVFNKCLSLKMFVINSSVSEITGSMFQDCYSVTLISIPENVRTILTTSFATCYSLTELVLPKNLAEIRQTSFSNCSSVGAYIFSCSGVPALGNVDVFTSINSTCRIYVPDALYDEWIAATNWASYANYIHKLSDYNK